MPIEIIFHLHFICHTAKSLRTATLTSQPLLSTLYLEHGFAPGGLLI